MLVTAPAASAVRHRDSASSLGSQASSASNNSARRRPGLAITPPPHAPFLPPPAHAARPLSSLSREHEWTTDDEGTAGEESGASEAGEGHPILGRPSGEYHNLSGIGELGDHTFEDGQLDLAAEAESVLGGVSSGEGAALSAVGPLAEVQIEPPTPDQNQVTQPTPTPSTQTTPCLARSPQQQSALNSPAYSRYDPASQPSPPAALAATQLTSSGFGLGLGLTSETIEGHSALISQSGVRSQSPTRTTSPIPSRLSGGEFPVASSAQRGTSPASLGSSSLAGAGGVAGSRSNTQASSAIYLPRASESSAVESSNSSVNIPTESAVDVSLSARSAAGSGVFMSVANSPLARLAADSGAVPMGNRQRVTTSYTARAILSRADLQDLLPFTVSQWRPSRVPVCSPLTLSPLS